MSLTVAPKEQLQAEGVLGGAAAHSQRAVWLLLAPLAMLTALIGLVLVARHGGSSLDASDVVIVVLVSAWAVCGTSLIRRKSALGRIALGAAAVAGISYLGAAWGKSG